MSNDNTPDREALIDDVYELMEQGPDEIIDYFQDLHKSMAIEAVDKEEIASLFKFADNGEVGYIEKAEIRVFRAIRETIKRAFDD